MELCVPDRDFSAPFKVEWLKVVHMPFKVFDREGMIINSFACIFALIILLMLLLIMIRKTNHSNELK